MKILFLCKGNICRSPAAMYYLQQRRPTWTVESMATTKNTTGQTIHKGMVGALERKLIPCNSRRMVRALTDTQQCMLDYDQIIDLHEAGLEDPYLTGDFDGALDKIVKYVDCLLRD